MGTLIVQPRKGRPELSPGRSPGFGGEGRIVPQGRLKPVGMDSAVPAGLAELLQRVPGLTSWAKFRSPLSGLALPVKRLR